MILWVEFVIVLLISAMTIVGIMEYIKIARLAFQKLFKNRKRRQI